MPNRKGGIIPTVSGKFNEYGFVCVLGSNVTLCREQFAESTDSLTSKRLCEERTQELAHDRRARYGGVSYKGILRLNGGAK